MLWKQHHITITCLFFSDQIHDIFNILCFIACFLLPIGSLSFSLWICITSVFVCLFHFERDVSRRRYLYFIHRVLNLFYLFIKLRVYFVFLLNVPILTLSPMWRGRAVRPPPSVVFLLFTQNIFRKPIPNFFLSFKTCRCPMNK